MLQDGQKFYQMTGLNRNTNLCFEPQNRFQRSKSWHRSDDDDDDNDDKDDDDDLTTPKKITIKKIHIYYYIFPQNLVQ